MTTSPQKKDTRTNGLIFPHLACILGAWISLRSPRPLCTSSIALRRLQGWRDHSPKGWCKNGPVITLYNSLYRYVITLYPDIPLSLCRYVCLAISAIISRGLPLLHATLESMSCQVSGPIPLPKIITYILLRTPVDVGKGISFSFRKALTLPSSDSV